MVSNIAVFLAGVGSVIVGMLWYSPLLFGNAWMKAAGMTKKDIQDAKKKGMASSMIAGFITYLIMAYVFFFLVDSLAITSTSLILKLSLIIWVGFFATTQLGAVLWENKPFKYYLINAGYTLTNLLVIGLIISYFI